MKQLKDIRIFITSNERLNSFLCAQNFKTKKFNLIATRLAKFLASQKLNTKGEYDHIYLIFREGKEEFNVLEETTKLEKELDWIKVFYVEISKKQFLDLDNENNTMEFYELLNKTISHIFPSNQNLINSFINSLIEYGEHMEIEYKSKNNGNIFVDLKYQLLDNRKFIPIIIISNKNGDVIRRFQLDPANELGMFGNVVINKSKVIIMPKKSVYFKELFPIEINI